MATSASQLHAVAIVDLALHRIEHGVDYATRAAALAPVNPAVLDTQAALLFAHGEVDRALAIQHLAIGCLPEDVDAPQLYEHLHRYEARAALHRAQ